LSKDWEVTPRGIYLVSRRLARPSWITARRRDLQENILSLTVQLKTIREKIEAKERLLRQLNSRKVNNHVKRMLRKEEIMKEKSQKLLRHFIGSVAYAALQRQKFITYTNKDGFTFRIYRDGGIFRKDAIGFQELCIIRPKDLPLPDFIISMLVNLRQNSKRFRERRRRG